MIEISMFSEYLVIFVSPLNEQTICKIIETCVIKKCNVEKNDDSIRVAGAKAQLFDVLLELTYDYHLWLD